MFSGEKGRFRGFAHWIRQKFDYTPPSTSRRAGYVTPPRRSDWLFAILLRALSAEATVYPAHVSSKPPQTQVQQFCCTGLARQANTVTLQLRTATKAIFSERLDPPL